MFKNAILYRITALPAMDAHINAGLQQDYDFVPCAPSQEKSIGWVPPRGDKHGPLLESVGGQWILKLMIETRAVPGNVITKKASERVAQIEAATGRKPGKKETREIKDDIKLELMPLAFSKESATLVWIDPAALLLVIDASSQSKADEVVTMLVKSIEGLAVRLIDTKISPTAAMSEWLITQEPPTGFTVDRECELKAADESKATIKYGRHPLDIDEVRAHVEGGKLPTKLALTWDSRVSFVLTEGLLVKKLTFLEAVFDGSKDGAQDGFDADVAIATGELRKLLPDLLDALGGEVAVQADTGTHDSVVQAAQNLHNMAVRDGYSVSVEDSVGTVLAKFGTENEADPLYDKAVEVVLKNQKASISLVQRHLAIGYNRAARLLEAMENAGIVGHTESSGHRAILKTAGEVAV
jgi:recombination associated protein RdgC